MRKLVLIILIFMLIGLSPVISSSGELDELGLESNPKKISGSFCKSGEIVPIDCTEADKNLREIWFEFNNDFRKSVCEKN